MFIRTEEYFFHYLTKKIMEAKLIHCAYWFLCEMSSRGSRYLLAWPDIRLVFSKPDIQDPGRSEEKKLDRPGLRIVRERRIVKRFTAIEFKQKWIMPFCSPTHLASDWYWTLIAQINLRFSNRLVNINHLYLPRRNFSSVFRSRQDLKFEVWTKSVLSFGCGKKNTYR
jgi:hypothetical protein